MDNYIGKYLREKRSAMGLSLREFGKLCGMSHTHIDSIEKGVDMRTGRAVNVTSQTLAKLSHALGVSEAELIGGQADNISDSQLKLALFGRTDVPDALLSEVKNFAQYVKSREGL